MNKKQLIVVAIAVVLTLRNLFLGWLNYNIALNKYQYSQELTKEKLAVIKNDLRKQHGIQYGKDIFITVLLAGLLVYALRDKKI